MQKIAEEAQVRYIPSQPKDSVMYAKPTPENVAPTYPKNPVIPQAAEIASFTVTRDV